MSQYTDTGLWGSLWGTEGRNQDTVLTMSWSTIKLGLAVRLHRPCPCDTKQSSHITTVNKTLIGGAGCRSLEIMTVI